MCELSLNLKSFYSLTSSFLSYQAWLIYLSGGLCLRITFSRMIHRWNILLSSYIYENILLLPQLINSSFIYSRFILLEAGDFHIVPETKYLLMGEGALMEILTLYLRSKFSQSRRRPSGYLAMARAPYPESRRDQLSCVRCLMTFYFAQTNHILEYFLSEIHTRLDDM